MSKTLSIDLIIADAGTQMRAGTRHETIVEYAELLEGSKKWPFDTAVVVFYDGEQYYLADGFHRFEACQRVSRASVLCDIQKGSLRDAIKYALCANQKHGLRRSNDDKRTAVIFVLNDPEWGKLSSREVAGMAGVSHTFVDKLRKEISPQVATVATCDSGNPIKTEESEKRIGKDGKKQSSTKKTTKRKTGKGSGGSGSEKPAIDAWKVERSKGVKTAEALQRSVDDLNDLKPRKVDHQRLIQIAQEAVRILKEWK